MTWTKIRNDAHVSHGGMKCPECNSDDIETGYGFEVSDAYAWQDVRCVDCDYEWTDVYVLAGYEDIGL